MSRALGSEIPLRIIKLFLGDAPQRLAKLRRSFVAGDVRAMEHAAHSLKGSSANLGALAFAALCHDMERRCREALPTAAEERLTALETEYGKVEEAMRELLREFS